MKMTQMPLVHAVNLVANSVNTAYGVDLISMMASQITGFSIVCSTVCSGADQENIKAPHHWLCDRIHMWPVDYPHKGPVTQKMFPFDDVIMNRKFPKLFNMAFYPGSLYWSYWTGR